MTTDKSELQQILQQLTDTQQQLAEFKTMMVEKMYLRHMQLIAKIEENEKKNYQQLEAFYWLAQQLKLKHPLPSLRGFPTSPDFLLKLHQHIRQQQPEQVVEFGSGVSTLVIADALRQNGHGRLLSIEHHADYLAKTWHTIQQEQFESYVHLQHTPLTAWTADHLCFTHADDHDENNDDHATAEQPTPQWYDLSNVSFEHFDNIELVIVDGPPAATGKYARYPALPAIKDHLAAHVEIWMDDLIRGEEQAICEAWCEQYDFFSAITPLEKGLAILHRNTVLTAQK